MHLFGLVLFGLIAFVWLTHGLACLWRIALPWIRSLARNRRQIVRASRLLFAATLTKRKLPAAPPPEEIDTRIEVIACRRPFAGLDRGRILDELRG